MAIRVLGPETVARIAAGEVVERPAAVVKELIENSLDAGSTQISVESRGGGVALVQVADNGCGIPADELDLAFQRHATSKLATASDLESISTLGFRGEALPSIAAVSEVELVSCQSGEKTGNYVELSEGKVVGRGGRGRPTGTTVTVRNLFRNVPARLKFLRSTATENGHIANIVSQYALAYPEVKFSLITDDRVILNTNGSGRLLDSVLAIYGLDTARSMIEIKRDGKLSGSIAVGGLIGAPHISRASRDYLSFFVNRRWISGRLLARAVEDAYHGILTIGKHPVAIINLELPAREVDVNIHPAKTEVKFQNESHVFGAVQKAVRTTLLELAPVPMLQQPAAVYTAPAPPSNTQRQTPSAAWRPPVAAPESSPLPSTASPLPWTALPALRLLGQLGATYVVAEGPDGLYLIDQHAAHERIMFEKVQRQRAGRGIDIQGLLEPITFEATPRQAAVMKVHRDDLIDFGFSIEPFGSATYLVRAAPAGLDAKGCIETLRELLDTPGERADWQERILQSVACHSAVRAGQALSQDEMRQLVRELEQTASPHTCPHGRPTMTHLSLAQLEKEFRRTQ
jgi:DNA mismatch repair protein MutL